MRSILWRLVSVFLVSLAAGCGGSNRVEMPTNPAPMPKNPEIKSANGLPMPPAEPGPRQQEPPARTNQ
jgi:hypothetical protein